MNRLALTFFAACSALAVACSKPQAPTVTPRTAKVTNVSLQGIDLEAELSVYNPNDIDLSVKSVTAKVTLDHKYDVGEFSEKKQVLLPAKKRVNVKMPIKVRWADMMGLAELATSNRDIDYLIDGTAEIGGDVLRANLPFSITGRVTHAELMKAAGQMVPRGLPLPLPF